MSAYHENVLSEWRCCGHYAQPSMLDQPDCSNRATEVTKSDVCVWRTYFLRVLELVVVSVLSVRSSRSRSVLEEPQERPRVSLAWLLLSRLGPGVVADPDVTWGVEAEPLPLLPPLLPCWTGRDRGWLWLWFCSGVSDPRGPRSSLRSWFSWLTRSNWPSSSSIRLRWVSRSLAWLSMMLLSSSRYSTARLGLSELDSMVGALPLGVRTPPAGVLPHPCGAKIHPPHHPWWVGGREGPTKSLLEFNYVALMFRNRKSQRWRDREFQNDYISLRMRAKMSIITFYAMKRVQNSKWSSRHRCLSDCLKSQSFWHHQWESQEFETSWFTIYREKKKKKREGHVEWETRVAND